MKECASTATTLVLVNDSPTMEFKLERGLRQGDPLSHFLYLIAVEGLNMLISKVDELGLFEAAYVGRENQNLTSTVSG